MKTPFTNFVRAEVAGLIRDLQKEMKKTLVRDTLNSNFPYIPCPEHIGNDPCDDQDPEMDEDY